MRPPDSYKQHSGYRRSLPAALLILAVAACSDGVGPVDPVAALLYVDGTWQAGDPDQPLQRDFVVRVVNREGAPLAGVPVLWTVTAGSGRFQDPGGNVLNGPLVTLSNGDGLTSTRFVPTTPGRSSVQASVDNPTVPPVTFISETIPEPDPEPEPAALLYVSGDGQVGKTDHRLAEKFVVRATDSEGRPLEGVAIRWRVLTGEGRLESTPGPFVDGHVIVRTDGNGLASTRFIPRRLGRSTIDAQVIEGPASTPVTFTADVTTLVIWIVGDWGFFAEGVAATSFTVPAGTAVEWMIDVWSTWSAHIVTLSAPSHSAHLDSGIFGFAGAEHLDQEACCFTYVPEVTGTWEFANKVAGTSGTLTVH